MNHRQRMERVLSGESPDRVPISFWRHFPVDDQDPYALMRSTLWFQTTYDFDLVKVSPSSSFCLRDWGAVDEWTGNPEGTRNYHGAVIQRPEDWRRLPRLSPRRGFLSEYLEALRSLLHTLSPSVPVIQTVFSPLAQAKDLVGGENFLLHLRRYGEEVREGLATIEQTTLEFIQALKQVGVDGVFFAVQQAQYGLLSLSEFEEFGKAFDLHIAEAVRELPFNVLHIHGQQVLFDPLLSYGFPILNWEQAHGSPDLCEGQQRGAKVVCGGLDRWQTMALGTPQDVTRRARQAICETDGKGFILGADCVLPVVTPHGNILAAKDAAAGAYGSIR